MNKLLSVVLIFVVCFSAFYCSTPVEAATVKVLCLGDSITQGAIQTGDPSNPFALLAVPYPAALGNLLACSVVNGGVGGDTTAKMLNRWNLYYKDSGFSSVVVLGGINDIWAGVPVSTIESNLLSIWQSAKSRGCVVYACTVMPANYTPVQTLNSWIKNTAPAYGVYVVDLYPVFNDPARPGCMKTIYDSGDGGHPNQAGAFALADSVYGVMRGAVVQFNINVYWTWSG